MPRPPADDRVPWWPGLAGRLVAFAVGAGLAWAAYLCATAADRRSDGGESLWTAAAACGLMGLVLMLLAVLPRPTRGRGTGFRGSGGDAGSSWGDWDNSDGGCDGGDGGGGGD